MWSPVIQYFLRLQFLRLVLLQQVSQHLGYVGLVHMVTVIQERHDHPIQFVKQLLDLNVELRVPWDHSFGASWWHIPSGHFTLSLPG
jgi:hypothetical protein